MGLHGVQPRLSFGGRCGEAIACCRDAAGARPDFPIRFAGSRVPMPPAPSLRAPLCGMAKDRFGAPRMVSGEHRPEHAKSGRC
jgi:hypothetical protein